MTSWKVWWMVGKEVFMDRMYPWSFLLKLVIQSWVILILSCDLIILAFIIRSWWHVSFLGFCSLYINRRRGFVSGCGAEIGWGSFEVSVPQLLFTLYFSTQFRILCFKGATLQDDYTKNVILLKQKGQSYKENWGWDLLTSSPGNCGFWLLQESCWEACLGWELGLRVNGLAEA